VTTADPAPELRTLLAGENFIQLSAPANTMLATPFKSFDEYLASLPRKVRWDIKDKIRKFEAAGGRIEQRIQLGQDAKRVYELFQKTSKEHEGQEVAWPVIPNLTMFEQLEQLGDSHRMLLAYVRDQLIGFLMLAKSGETLFFKFCGLDYDLCRESMAYFNLFYLGIRYGIENGCSQISLGPTSYFNKERLGAEQRPIDLQIGIFRGVLKLVRRFANLVV
jgi:predicted N-acyltransferase